MPAETVRQDPTAGLKGLEKCISVRGCPDNSRQRVIQDKCQNEFKNQITWIVLYQFELLREKMNELSHGVCFSKKVEIDNRKDLDLLFVQNYLDIPIANY